MAKTDKDDKPKKGGAPDLLRAKATERAAELYLQIKREGGEPGLPQCCDQAAAETGYPRPAESSVRRIIAKLMTDEEKEQKKAKDAKSDRRAEATRHAAEIYRKRNGDSVTIGEVAPAISVTRCCELAAAEFGIRPAESSMRRVLTRMYEEEGIRPKEGKKKGKKEKGKKDKKKDRKEKRDRSSSSGDKKSRKKAKKAKSSTHEPLADPAAAAVAAAVEHFVLEQEQSQAPLPPAPVPTQLSDQQVLFAAVGGQQPQAPAQQQAYQYPPVHQQYYTHSMPPLPGSEGGGDVVGV